MSGPTLKRGSKGPEVRELQTKLAALHFYAKAIDDSFGPGCQEAVQAFQKAHHIPHTGVVGPITWKALDNEFAAHAPVPFAPPEPPKRKVTPEPGADTPLIKSFVASADGKSGASIQVKKSNKFKLSWQVIGPMRHIKLQGATEQPRNASGTLELIATKDEDFTLEASNDEGWDAKTVHIATHEEHEEVSNHTEVTLEVPVKGEIYRGSLLPKKWGELKYFVIEVELSIEAKGSLLVGRGVGGGGDHGGGLGVNITPSGYNAGKMKKAVALKIDKRFGHYDIVLEDVSLVAKIGKDGATIEVELKVKAYGVGAAVKLILIKVDKEWKKSALAQAEIDISIPFFKVNIPLDKDVKIKSLEVAPHIKGIARPNWKRIAWELAKRFGIKVAEKVLEGAAETAVEGATEAAAEALTEAEIAAAEAAAEEAAGEDLMLLAGTEVLVASAALLISIYIMVKTFQDMAQGEWNRTAGKKVEELTYIYIEGYRKGLFDEPEPTDEREKIAYPRGAGQLKIYRAGYYRWYHENFPSLPRAEVDREIDELVREFWGNPHDASTWKGDVTRTARDICERTAQVTLFSAWAKEGHGGITDWPDRGWAFRAVFGKNPHYDKSVMEPWEKETWEHFYGKEYN